MVLPVDSVRLCFCQDVGDSARLGFLFKSFSVETTGKCFFTSDKDIAAYANSLKEGAIKFDLRVHAWVFMTNHVHLLLTPMQNSAVSRLMQYLGRLNGVFTTQTS